MSDRKLEQLRKQMDQLDDEIVAALERRARLVSEIASFKKANEIPLMDPGRESEIIARITAKSCLPSTALEEVFDAILVMCKKALAKSNAN